MNWKIMVLSMATLFLLFGCSEPDYEDFDLGQVVVDSNDTGPDQRVWNDGTETQTCKFMSDCDDEGVCTNLRIECNESEW